MVEPLDTHELASRFRDDPEAFALTFMNMVNSFGTIRYAKALAQRMADEHNTLEQSAVRLLWQTLMEYADIVEERQGAFEDLRNEAAHELVLKLRAMRNDVPNLPMI